MTSDAAAWSRADVPLLVLAEIPMWILVGALAIADEVLIVKTLLEFWANQLAVVLG